MSKRAEKAAAGPCPIMRSCGGCTWLGMPYKKQLARKQQRMEALFQPVLERYGWHIALDPIAGMGGTPETAGRIPSPRAFRYKASTPFAPAAAHARDTANRNRTTNPSRSRGKGRSQVDPSCYGRAREEGDSATRDGEIACGFFAAGTHRIVPAAACPVEAPGARQILNGVARSAEQLGISAYNEDTGRGLLRHAIVRLGWKTNEGILTVVTSNRDLPHADAFARALTALDPRITCVAQNVNPRPGNAILGPTTHILAGEPVMHDELLGCTFAISPTAFYQTNPAQTEVLYRLAIEGMALEDGDTLVDAYCGSGTIGICAAHAARACGHAVTLIGMERNPAGVADARLNARLNGFAEDAATFIAEDATCALNTWAREGRRADVIVLDPPRAGSTPAFLSAAAATGARRIVYISCNPETQARDLATLAQEGYRLIRLAPVDMFPHTEHIETVAVLQRR